MERGLFCQKLFFKLSSTNPSQIVTGVTRRFQVSTRTCYWTGHLILLRAASGPVKKGSLVVIGLLPECSTSKLSRFANKAGIKHTLHPIFQPLLSSSTQNTNIIAVCHIQICHQMVKVIDSGAVAFFKSARPFPL